MTLKINNQRWMWFDQFGSPKDDSVLVYRAYVGCWFLVRRGEMIGPLNDDAVLRTYRIARSYCVDGCQLGPPAPGWTVVGTRRPCRHESNWVAFAEDELPLSITTYDASGLEPIGCCCSNFEGWPEINPSQLDWQTYLESPPQHWGVLVQAWNAHPVGSLVMVPQDWPLGLTIVDFASPDSR